MTKKDTHTAHYTLSSLPKGKTKWEKFKALKDDEIAALAESDDDNPLWTQDMIETAHARMPQRKVSVHMYLDQEIVDWFKRSGKGYQSRINAVLKSYVHRHPN